MNTYTLLTEILGKDKVFADKNLFPYLTLRTSTVAEYFFEAHTKEDFVLAIQTAKKHRIPLTMIGGGSNIAATKSKIPGLVIKNNYAKLELLKEEKEYVEVLVSSGYTITLLVNKTIEKGWAGFEHHEGLPGTMGGAMYMNSKWTHPWSYVSDPLVSATLLDSRGELKTVNRDYFCFAYDYSILQKTHEVFIDGVFRLEKKIRQSLSNNLMRRCYTADKLSHLARQHAGVFLEIFLKRIRKGYIFPRPHQAT